MNFEIIISWLLFFIGIGPIYVNYYLVEKYYTNFWTGYWNLYFVAITFVSGSLANRSILPGIIAFVLLLFLFLTFDNQVQLLSKKLRFHYKKRISLYQYIWVYLTGGVRTLGSSLICTSLGWFAFIWGLSNYLTIGLIYGIGNLFVLIIIIPSDNVRNTLLKGLTNIF